MEAVAALALVLEVALVVAASLLEVALVVAASLLELALVALVVVSAGSPTTLGSLSLPGQLLWPHPTML